MPSAENGKLVNGEVTSSAFFTHLKSIPVISDSISGFKANPYGQKSISIADQGYHKFASPVIPYLHGPYQFVSPYVAKADSLADNGLSKLEQTFPIVKEPSEKVKGTIYQTASYPFRLVFDGKEYVLKTYGSEYKKVGGEGVVTTGKALVSTSLAVTLDVWTWVGNYFGTKKEQTKGVVNEKMNHK